MSIKVKIEYVSTAQWLFDETRGIGIEVNVRDRKFYSRVDLETMNGMQEPNRVETTFIPRLGRHFFIKPLINRAFKKIKHRYTDWGLNDDIRFPWKAVV